MGARVMWPPDIPDHMLKMCLTKTTDLFGNHQEELATKG